MKSRQVCLCVSELAVAVAQVSASRQSVSPADLQVLARAVAELARVVHAHCCVMEDHPALKDWRRRDFVAPGKLPPEYAPHVAQKWRLLFEGGPESTAPDHPDNPEQPA